jgi:Ca-activated chloride channel family protein
MQSTGQYYLRGDVRDEEGKVLPDVKISLHSKGSYPFYTGSSGAFGIPTNSLTDSITITAEGFEPITQFVEATKFYSFVLKATAVRAKAKKNKLLSFTKNLWYDSKQTYINSNESYSSLVENGFIESGKYAETGFALNINRASYSNIRRFINMGYKVPRDAVRIEEMLNYFDFSQNNPDTNKHAFVCNTNLTSTPWNKKNELLFINLQAPKLDFKNVPPTNLIFLIDVSGSMDRETRLPLLKSAFKLLVKNLREQDTVAIVVYGGTVNIVLQPTSGKESEKIVTAIEELTAGGETPGESAIKLAYALAERSFNKKGNNRVILATDGDFNVGQTTEKELEELIIAHKHLGIYLTCLGVGMGNYKDSKLEALAKNGNGNFAYIDNINEAEKVLITEFSKTVYAVANDAYLQVKFNPELVKEHRLIGFDNKMEALDDTSSTLEGGEVGSGHSLIGIFEIVPTEKIMLASEEHAMGYTVAELKLQYKLPATDSSCTQYFDVKHNYKPIEKSDSSSRFASAIVMFGSLLKQSKWSKNFSWDDVIALATSAYNTKDVLQTEFLELVQKAKRIYSDKKRRNIR